MKRLVALVILAHLVQCRPIDLSEGWDLGKNQTGEVIAKIVCQCGTSEDLKQTSYVLQTSDIRQTCSEGDRLCDSVCTD